MTRWPEVVIFDCDGVLVDSEVLSLARVGAALSRLGLPLSEARLRDLFLGVSARSMGETVERMLGLPLPPDFQETLARDVMVDFERELRGIPGVADAIARLRARVCVASSSSIERIRASLRIVGYADLFGADVFSASEVARGKPAPDLFLHAARRMGAEPSNCLVIEDSVPGVTAAGHAGIVAFGFVGGAHVDGAEHGARLRDAGAAVVFADMRELPALVAARGRA
jgi:HAD superfamily hydrolase (TIGR01509 family)